VPFVRWPSHPGVNMGQQRWPPSQRLCRPPQHQCGLQTERPRPLAFRLMLTLFCSLNLEARPRLFEKVDSTVEVGCCSLLLMGAVGRWYTHFSHHYHDGHKWQLLQHMLIPNSVAPDLHSSSTSACCDSASLNLLVLSTSSCSYTSPQIPPQFTPWKASIATVTDKTGRLCLVNTQIRY
jgi:hypothetical protein